MGLLNKDSNGLRKCASCEEYIPKGMKFWYTTYKSAYHGSKGNVNLCGLCIKDLAKRINKKEVREYKKMRIISKL